MAITDIPIFSMLRTRLQWAQQRQAVLAQNVANADTPHFRGRDLVAPKFEDPTKLAPTTVANVTLARTDSGHIEAPGGGDPSFRSVSANYEVSPTGTSVNLEDEMMKVAATQMDYQAATALYTRSLSLIKTALGRGPT